MKKLVLGEESPPYLFLTLNNDSKIYIDMLLNINTNKTRNEFQVE